MQPIAQYIGIEIGGTKLQVVGGDGAGRVAQRCRMTVEAAGGAAGIRQQIARGVEQVLREGPPARAVGVGFGGPVDRRSGRVTRSYQIEGWVDFEIGTWLRELTGLPVSVDNDANVAALAEARLGAGRGHRLVFYTNLGSGQGGGMVIDGRIYHGHYPGESEIGLMCFDKSGATVESRCCGWAVDGRIRRYVAEHPQSLLGQLAGERRGGESRFLRAAIDGGDGGAAAILAEAAEDLAFALSLVSHLFHPEIVVIGGGLSLVGEPLRMAVADRLPGFMTASLKPGPRVALAALGEDVVAVGALLLAGERDPGGE